jgi:hypothetical protein
MSVERGHELSTTSAPETTNTTKPEATETGPDLSSWLGNWRPPTRCAAWGQASAGTARSARSRANLSLGGPALLFENIARPPEYAVHEVVDVGDRHPPPDPPAAGPGRYTQRFGYRGSPQARLHKPHPPLAGITQPLAVRPRRRQPKVPRPQRRPPKPACSAPHQSHPHSDSSEADA